MNKDQINIKLQALPFFKGSLDLEFIEGFMANDNYIVSDDRNKYVVKIGGDKQDYGVVRSHEIEASKAGYKAGISPKVFYFVSYTDKVLKRYEKQFDNYNSLRTAI